MIPEFPEDQKVPLSPENLEIPVYPRVPKVLWVLSNHLPPDRSVPSIQLQKLLVVLWVLSNHLPPDRLDLYDPLHPCWRQLHLDPSDPYTLWIRQHP